ncbi:MAG: carbohydrate ABC transporter permease, partial [Anaerolineaceae bacterium]
MAIDSSSQISQSSNWSKKNKIREALWGYLLITPNFLIILLFTIIPVFFSFYMSLTDWNILSAPSFIGLENYQDILKDALAKETFLNTFYFTIVSVPINVIFTLILAILLNQKIRGITFFRTAFYLPVISASVAVSLMFMWILANNGLLNQMLESIRLE